MKLKIIKSLNAQMCFYEIGNKQIHRQLRNIARSRMDLYASKSFFMIFVVFEKH